MKRATPVLILQAVFSATTRRAPAQACGELHCARLSGEGWLAYRCGDETCWLREPYASDRPSPLTSEEAGRESLFSIFR